MSGFCPVKDMPRNYCLPKVSAIGNTYLGLTSYKPKLTHVKKLLLSSLIALASTGLFAQTALTTAVDFDVTDVHGNSYNLFDILAGGQHVVVDFFFTTCGPCIASVPTLNTLYTDYGCNTGDVFFISVDAGDSEAEVLQYESDYGGLLPSVSGTDGGGDATVSAYGITAYPTVILIAPNHDIVSQDIFPVTEPNFEAAISGTNITQQSCSTVGIEDFDVSSNAIAGTYPNPAVNNSKMDFTVGNTEKVSFAIYNVLGVQVAWINEKHFNQGLHTVALPIDGLATGQYLVNMMVNGTRADVKKFSVIK